MTRETLAVAVLVWLIGALVGWFVGWAARGDENRRWVETTRRRIDYAENQARDAIAELDRVTAQRLDQSWMPAPAPAVVHVHMSPLLPWVPQQPLPAAPTRALEAAHTLPVPGEGVES